MSTLDRSNRALAQLCAQVFLGRATLVSATRLRLPQGFVLPPHTHRAILQVDLALHTGGHWWLAGKKAVPQAAGAAIFYPGREHGYHMPAPAPQGEILSFKLVVQRGWPALKERIFPELIPNLAGAETLVNAMRRVARLGVQAGPCAPLLASAIAEVLCLWPRPGAEGAPRDFDAADDTRLAPALALIEERLAEPPDLKELAAVVHLSPRHCARFFSARLGVTPHGYIAARRAIRARELLAQARTSITETSAALGFPTIHGFSRWFRTQTGVTPSAFQKNPGLL